MGLPLNERSPLKVQSSPARPGSARTTDLIRLRLLPPLHFRPQTQTSSQFRPTKTSAPVRMSVSLSMSHLLLLRTPFLAPSQSLTRSRPIPRPGTRTATSTVVSLSRNNNGNGNDPSTADAPDRLISAVAYFYPFFDGIQYGRYLITQYPTFGSLIYPFLPAIRAFRSFPLNSFLVFVTLYFVVVRNQNFSRYVRFNTMQAIVLDVLLIFPELLERSFGAKEGFGFDLLMSLDSTVFLYLLVCLVYGSGCCLVGKVPRLPIVAEAAERQVL